jgi:hypothetical protein
MQRFEKSNQRRRLRRIQILSIRRHISAALQNLTHQLVPRQSNGHSVESGPTLATYVAKRMAVVALFRLKDKRSLDLERRASRNEFPGNRSSGGGIHNRTPWCMVGQIGKRA